MALLGMPASPGPGPSCGTGGCIYSARLLTQRPRLPSKHPLVMCMETEQQDPWCQLAEEMLIPKGQEGHMLRVCTWNTHTSFFIFFSESFLFYTGV